MSDEEAMFEVWFQLQRKKDWERRYPNEAFHENWGLGSREAMREGWLARASLHVVNARMGPRGCAPDCVLPAGHLGPHSALSAPHNVTNE